MARFTARATTASPTTAAPIATTATATAAAFFARTGFIHFDITAMKRLAGQAADRGLRAFIGGHGYECKASGPAAHAVSDEINICYGAELFEEILQIVFCGVEGKVSDEQFITHYLFTLDPLHFLSRSRTPGFKSLTEHLFT